jgi:type III restriction enzyme
MKVELFPFQKIALFQLRRKTAEALGSYQRTHTPQVLSFTAPTGAGKTIILASLIESIYFGDEEYPDQPDAIFVWLSDSPELNEQSRSKIDLKADKIRLDQCVTITDESFDQEMLDDGHIYFLNTQKLGKSSNLTKKGDGRTFTIWETLQNTMDEKYDRLYFIIDEAHRGMQGRAAAQATTIMQKFLKGSREDRLAPVPVVLGVTATPERFNNLVSGTESTIQKVIVSADDVRASGLLKDRIIIAYPEDASGSKDMAVLQAAADDWKQKWEHWSQYCQEQHYAYVNPVFVIQVQNQTGSGISDTDLDDCLRKIEERTGFRFQDGEVVHTFGQTTSTIQINGVAVRYLEPSRIADEKNVKVVFFKENLSTGWDCPRAETMMSFRRATDATYIAQLLGRMVRTPMQMHIQVDDVLNDVHLYLPYFDAQTVEDVVKALQSTEGGEIPTDVIGDSFENSTIETWTVRPTRPASAQRLARPKQQLPGQISWEDSPSTETGDEETSPAHPHAPIQTGNEISGATAAQPPVAGQTETAQRPAGSLNTETRETPASRDVTETESPVATVQQPTPDDVLEEPELDREAIVKAINDAGLLTYDVRRVRINDYLKSLFSLTRLLTQSGLQPSASYDVINEIVEMIHSFIKKKKDEGQYDELATQVMQFKLKTQTFDVFGESVDDHPEMDLFSTTDTDLDRQFRLAELKLGNEGVGIRYGTRYADDDNPAGYKIDVIIFAADADCMDMLHNYARSRFHDINDANRRRITGLTERYRKKYDSIVSDGDIISKHNFRLPETISIERSNVGEAYTDHLFVDNATGKAVINLNNWEKAVLQAERSRSDYICWLRNPPRKSWSLCIPYEQNAEKKSMYPDFLIIRKDEMGFVIDILEPHDGTRTDNLGKAKGFAEYARQNPGVGRLQLIRLLNGRIKRLDMSRSAVRDRVSHAMSNDELDHIFDEDGFFG